MLGNAYASAKAALINLVQVCLLTLNNYFLDGNISKICFKSRYQNKSRSQLSVKCCLSVFDHFVGLLLRGLMPDSGHASFEYSWRFLNVLNINFNFTWPNNWYEFLKTGICHPVYSENHTVSQQQNTEQ